MYLFLGCLVAVLAGGSRFAEASTVPVAVYYESLCPDSIKFYVEQLYPAMENTNLSTQIDLTLVPYGKSSYEKIGNESWNFTCHHGEAECHGNKVHACAVDLISSRNEMLAYLNCLLKSKDLKKNFPTEMCAEEVNIGSVKPQIVQCANSTDGARLLAKMGDQTNALMPKLTSVPTVVFNNKYDKSESQQAQQNFRGVLCKYISSPKPAECSGANTISMSLFVLFATLSLIFSQHF